MRIVSLEKCDNEIEFARRITKSTNFQNQIGLRDFAAQYEQQEIIARHLEASGIFYHYKGDTDTPSPDDKNFTLEEATTACACLAQLSDCDYVARVLANRSSLWSFERIYNRDDPLPSRCERIFRPDRSARTVWRAVQVQRLVISLMQSSGRSEIGVRKAFYESGRWLVLNLLFLRLRPESGSGLALKDQEVAEIGAAINEIAESLFEECVAKGFVTSRTDQTSGLQIFEMVKHFRSVFSAPGDCQTLRNGLLARLARAGRNAESAGAGLDSQG
jgi:hypothetical protein